MANRYNAIMSCLIYSYFVITDLINWIKMQSFTMFTIVG